MANTYIAFLVTIVSLLVSLFVYPRVLDYARRHNIVDNPNARKLQRIPVPVMGGLVVYAGILTGFVVLSFFLHDINLILGIVAMSVMLFIGIWDDIRDLSARLRFLVEFILVGIYMAMTGDYIDSFHGMFGIFELDEVVAIPLSLIAGVGIMNAVNLIDGVDGYSSGYGMFACGCFAIIFYIVWRPVWVCIAMIVVASMLPFFMHNVFGVRTKMFIGDGGTLMLGMLMTILVFETLSSKSRCVQFDQYDVCVPAMTLAVLCIPVFDTLRVMLMRILRGCSPFKPDKTHLHHLFIDMGFSHLGAAMSILLINAVVVLMWLLMWWLGASVDVQAVMVVLMGLMVTFVFYKVMRTQQSGGPVDEDGYPQGSWLWYMFCRIGEMSHFEKGALWRRLRLLMDSSIFFPSSRSNVVQEEVK